MILYRAINDKDYQNVVLNCKNIYAIRTRSKEDFETVLDYYSGTNMQNSFNFIMNHINGKWAEKKATSPWISLSKDLFYTIEAYSMPQAIKKGNDTRRSIVVVDQKRVLSAKEEIENAKGLFAIDLSDDNILNLVRDGIIKIEEYDKTRLDFRLNNSLYRDCLKSRKSERVISSKASVSSEVLAYLKVNYTDIKAILYPIIIDLMYSYNLNIDMDNASSIQSLDNMYSKLQSLYDSMDPLYLDLYPDVISGVDLTSYLIEHYNTIEGDNVEEKYENLKERKRELLFELATQLFGSKGVYKPQRLVDDLALVYEYNHLMQVINNRSRKLSKSFFDNILIIEKDGELFVYNNDKDTYESRTKTIDRKLILNNK